MTVQVTAADLRAVAADMREKANAVNGVWYDDADDLADHLPCNIQDGRADAVHAIAWHPGVALAVADWLDHTAKTWEGDLSDYCAGQGHQMWSPAQGAFVVPCTSWWCSNVDRAIAVVRAWRGEQP